VTIVKRQNEQYFNYGVYYGKNMLHFDEMMMCYAVLQIRYL